ncbi:MAG: CHAD domain-containing protein [Humibacter sp.]
MPGKRVTAGAVLSGAMMAAVVELEGFESGIRVNADDALHQARTRVRRMRSILSVYPRVFEPSARRDLRAQLAELGELLGSARDDEVRTDALRKRWEAADDDATRIALLRLVTVAAETEAKSHADAVAVLDSPAHRALLADLRTFVAHAFAGPDADRRVTAVARRSLRKACRKVDRAAASSDGDLEHLHATRKAARRVRYAADAVQQDVAGASDLAAAAEAVQDALGDHRDAMLLADELRDWSVRAHDAPTGTVRSLADTLEQEAEVRLRDLDALVPTIGEAAERVG